MHLTRRHVAAAALASLIVPAAAKEAPPFITYEQDFDELWSTLAARYCYFAEKATDWDAVRRLYRPQAERAQSADAMARIAARVLNELYDAHTHLNDPPNGVRRYPPFDLVVDREGEAARVVAVLEHSSAARAGLAIGDLILTAEDRRLADVAADCAPRCLKAPDPAAERYAWNAAVAGHRGGPRRFGIRTRGGTDRTVDLPLVDYPARPDVAAERLESGIGHIRIASFADQQAIFAFEDTLQQVADLPGLIVDVRDNGGGDAAVARPIMGLFVTARTPFARMARREGQGLGPTWTEFVDPRSPTAYAKPVVVLVNRWSASMAEGFAMGMRAICGARIVGAPMMGLGAAVFPLRLDRTGVDLQYSAEAVFDLAGQPRGAMQPDVRVADGDAALAAAVAEIRRLSGN